MRRGAEAVKIISLEYADISRIQVPDGEKYALSQLFQQRFKPGRH
jgi:hypothetical protein